MRREADHRLLPGTEPSAVAPVRAKITFAILLGAVLGLGLFTFGYARGSAYLTNDPAACANCHIMSEHFAAWTKSSHRQVATCNDCHTPHSFLGKYATKARTGSGTRSTSRPAGIPTRCASRRATTKSRRAHVASVTPRLSRRWITAPRDDDRAGLVRPLPRDRGPLGALIPNDRSAMP